MDGGVLKGLSVALVMLATAGCGDAVAQNWPTKPVRIVNTFAAGGAADVLGRMVADHLGTVFKQRFFVESRPGGAGIIGIQSVLSQDDGHNLVLTNSGQLVIAPLANPKLPYDPLGDLIHVGMLGGSPVAFSVAPKSGVKSVAELVARAKASPDPLTYSWSGIGTNGQFLVEAFAHQAGITLRHVPYKGAAQGLMDVAAGHVLFAASTVSSSAAQIQSGALMALAHTGPERMADYQDVPTLKELGYADLVSTTWFALSAPARMPRPIAERLNREINAAMATLAGQEFLRQQALVRQPLTIAEMHALIADEIRLWKPTVDRIAVTPN